MDVNLFVNIEVAKYEIVFQLIATAILLYLMYKKVFPNFRKYLNERKNFVNSTLEETKETRKRVKEIRQEKEEELENLKSSHDEIMESYQKEATLQADGIVEDARQRSRYLLEKNASDIEQEKNSVRQELSSEVLDTSILVAERFLGEKITDEDEMNMIKQALAEVKSE